jgi:hypothetical protein
MTSGGHLLSTQRANTEGFSVHHHVVYLMTGPSLIMTGPSLITTGPSLLTKGPQPPYNRSMSP